MKSIQDLAIDIRAIARDHGMLDHEGKFLGELIDYLLDEIPGSTVLDEARVLPNPRRPDLWGDIVRRRETPRHSEPTQEAYTVWFKAAGLRPELVCTLLATDAQAAIAYARPRIRSSKFAIGKMHAFRDGSHEEKAWLNTSERERVAEIGRREIPRPSKPGGTRLFEVWSEGYSASGDRAPAHMIGRYQARSFDEAVAFAAKGKRFRVSKRDGVWHDEFGCCLFDNEADARRAFGGGTFVDTCGAEPDHLLYDVWMQGGLNRGKRENACFLGRYRAKSFDEAAQLATSDKGLRFTRDHGFPFAEGGRQLFCNEDDARRAFG